RPVTCGNVELSQIWCPIRARISPPDPRFSLLSGGSHSRSPGRSVTADRCSWHLCCSFAVTGGHSPVAAKDVPPAILRETCLPEGDNQWQQPHPRTRRLD